MTRHKLILAALLMTLPAQAKIAEHCPSGPEWRKPRTEFGYFWYQNSSDGKSRTPYRCSLAAWKRERGES